MLKLYNQLNNQLCYWETWDKDENTAVIHWGIVGEQGENKEVKSGFFSNFRKIVQKEIDQALSQGYEEVDTDDHFTLLVEYAIEGMGSEADLDKRHRLEDKLDGILGWTGLGHCHGGSIGSGTMEVCCFVIDFEIAKRVIEEALKNTEFADFTRIYDEADL